MQIPTLLQDNRRVPEKSQESRFFFIAPSFVTSGLDVVAEFLWPAVYGLEDEVGIVLLFLFSLEVSLLDCFLGYYT